ncbi:MAG: UDP-N-acetylglucosamine 2-epimerase, partial [Gammaproteobacteria bacterium]
MPPQRIMAIFGTRPEAIKMAPVIRELRARPHAFALHVVFTGQHRQLSEPLIRLFSIAPDTALDTMTHAQRLGAVTARLIDKIDAIVSEVKPHWILAQGDTVSV